MILAKRLIEQSNTTLTPVAQLEDCLKQNGGYYALYELNR